MMGVGSLMSSSRGSGEGGSALPSWLLTVGGVVPFLDIDFNNDRAWRNGALVTIASLLTSNNALNYDSTGLLVSTGDNVNLTSVAGLDGSTFTVFTQHKVTAITAVLGKTVSLNATKELFLDEVTSGGNTGARAYLDPSILSDTFIGLSVGSTVKSALARGGTTGSFCANGRTPVSGTLNALGTISSFYVGRYQGGGFYREGRINRVTWFNAKLTNANLQTITA